jgi:hypothetical protein
MKCSDCNYQEGGWAGDAGRVSLSLSLFLLPLQLRGKKASGIADLFAGTGASLH